MADVLAVRSVSYAETHSADGIKRIVEDVVANGSEGIVGGAIALTKDTRMHTEAVSTMDCYSGTIHALLANL